MSGLSSSILKFLPSMPRPANPGPEGRSSLRYPIAAPQRQPTDPKPGSLPEFLEGLPSQRNHTFSPDVRREVIAALYSALFGIISPTDQGFKDMFPSGDAVLAAANSIGQSQVKNQPEFLAEFQAQAARERRDAKGKAREAHPVFPIDEDKEEGKRKPKQVPCGRIFKKGECCFRCKDCAQDDSCVLCAKCFNATSSLHASHNVSFFIAQQSGGCCDCGDAEAWLTDIQCPHHALPERNSANDPDYFLTAAQTTGIDVQHPPVNPISCDKLPPALRSRIAKMIATVLDFMLCTLDFSPDEPNAPASLAELALQPTGLAESGDTYALVLWNDDKHSFEEITNLLCDLGRESGVSASSSQFNFALPSISPSPQMHAEVLSMRLSHSNPAPANNALLSPPPFPRPPNGVGGGGTTTITPGAGILRRSRAEASALTHSIDQVGRATIAMSYPQPRRLGEDDVMEEGDDDDDDDIAHVLAPPARAPASSRHGHGRHHHNHTHHRERARERKLRRPAGLAGGLPPTPEDLLQIAHRVSQIDLGVTLRRAYDVFREDVVGVFVDFLVDLCAVHVSGLDDDGDDGELNEELSNANAGRRVLREILAEELFNPRRRDGEDGLERKIGGREGDLKRIDFLFLYHTKLWKKARLGMKEVYAAVGTLGYTWKGRVASHFALSYPTTLSSYLLVDREPETSIKYFALQVFTVPSIAYLVVKHHNLITRLLGVIVAFFGNRVESSRIVLYDPHSRNRMGTFAGIDTATYTFDPDSGPFKSKRFMPIFSDLRYLAHNPPVQRMIASSPTSESMMTEFSKCCQLFMAVNPNKRMKREHIEFESDSWISIFNVSLSLGRVIKVYGDAWSANANKGNVRELVRAIEIVLHHMLAVITNPGGRVDVPSFHQVSFAGSKWNVVHYDVSGEEGKGVSFHHSLHWLLAELLKHVDLLEDSVLKRELDIAGGLNEVMAKFCSQDALLSVLDFPLRVLVMIAQIRCGLWVRNGFAIRGQLLHYRDSMLRELCYDQDLYMLQVSFCFLPQDFVLVTIIDRFNLTSFFGGGEDGYDGFAGHDSYEGSQLFGMVEELLYIIVTILSEPSSAGKWSIRRQIRRELVHALVFGPTSYTDLVKRVAERLVDDAAFERVLTEVANFKAPDGVSDTGVYELKDECYAEVNPWYFHYARNRREDVESVLKERERKSLPGKKTEPRELVYIPKPWASGIECGGPLKAAIPRIFESRVLIQIVFYAVWHCYTALTGPGDGGGGEEAVMDMVLHLIMIGITEHPVSIGTLAIEAKFEVSVVGDEFRCLADVLCFMDEKDTWKGYQQRITKILDEFRKISPSEIDRRRVLKDTGAADVIVSEEEKRKAAAKRRQEAIMQRMKKQQEQAAVAMDSEVVDDKMDEDLDGDQVMHDTPSIDKEDTNISYGTCIVCQEDLTSAKAFGTLGMVQPSRFIRRHPDSHHSYLNEVLQSPPSLDRTSPSESSVQFPPSPERVRETRTNTSANFDGFPAQYTRFGLHSSVCSHMMHLECFQIYSVSIRQRHRAQATRNHPESIPRKEYICPLCKSLGNVILPVTKALHVELNSTPFPDWIRAAGIGILKSKPDPLLESLQFRNGTGEFVFWSAQDTGYASVMRAATEKQDALADANKMVDTVMVVSKSISLQTRHLRDRPEPELGERGAGLYLPEELVGYTIASMDISQRGSNGSIGTLLVDHLSEAQLRMVRGLVGCLTKLAALHFKGRSDEGREAVRQGIIKRLLPEWSRTSLTSFSYPLLLRDPFTVLVETAAVAPDMLRHALVLTYYACVARSVIGLVFVLNKTRSYSTVQLNKRSHENVLGDVRMFFMSVVRHSPVFEHTATLVFETFGEARIEKLLYAFTLPFLRRAAILCRSILPSYFPTPSSDTSDCEYSRLLKMLGIPPVSDLPNQDTLQNALSGWCAHYGHSHAASQFNNGVMLDYPSVYRFAKLPLVLDNLYSDREKMLTCPRCLTAPLDAAICLLCGTVCCVQSDCCTEIESSERGECNMHTRECAGAIGLFFLVKRCAMLYLYASNGTFGQSPYLDSHGELDISMRRGRRQYLQPARWEDIRKIWLTHGIPTVIARKLESSLDSGGWETL